MSIGNQLFRLCKFGNMGKETKGERWRERENGKSQGEHPPLFMALCKRSKEMIGTVVKKLTKHQLTGRREGEEEEEGEGGGRRAENREEQG